jgi:hypothetical protein
MEFTKFMPSIHEKDEAGDPIKVDGAYVLKKDWKTHARDKGGRPFDEAIHEAGPKGDPVLLSDGTLKMKAPVSKGPAGAILRLAIPPGLPTGYQYRWVNVDSRGRPDILASEHDWAMVLMDGKIHRKPVGNARDGLTEAVLMRKPQEWYDADQRKKDARNVSLEKSKAAVTDDSAEYVPRGRKEVLTDSRIA